MPPIFPPEVSQYIENIPNKQRPGFDLIFNKILTAVPEVTVGFAYRMPTFSMGGEIICALAAQKHYISLYLDPALVDQYRAKFPGLSIGKSCIRFRQPDDLPAAALDQLIDELNRRSK
ncbi:MAG: DUF1801 domain-containing protein [Anaerolineaceae bacterium]|nr:DUF1801 domain-containing protein [Anaerolineaceae bacterium]